MKILPGHRSRDVTPVIHSSMTFRKLVLLIAACLAGTIVSASAQGVAEPSASLRDAAMNHDAGGMRRYFQKVTALGASAADLDRAMKRLDDLDADGVQIIPAAR
jgi:hypothetical protein